jgi:hypothetical protein
MKKIILGLTFVAAMIIGTNVSAQTPVKKEVKKEMTKKCPAKDAKCTKDTKCCTKDAKCSAKNAKCTKAKKGTCCKKTVTTKAVAKTK